MQERKTIGAVARWLSTGLLCSGCLSHELQPVQFPLDLSQRAEVHWVAGLVHWEEFRGAPHLFLELGEHLPHGSEPSPLVLQFKVSGDNAGLSRGRGQCLEKR